MISSSISINILAVAAGIFLIQKMSKDNMGWFFKTAAYLILILSLLNFGTIGAEGMYKIYQKANCIYHPCHKLKSCKKKCCCMGKHKMLPIKNYWKEHQNESMPCCQNQDSTNVESK